MCAGCCVTKNGCTSRPCGLMTLVRDLCSCVLLSSVHDDAGVVSSAGVAMVRWGCELVSLAKKSVTSDGRLHMCGVRVTLLKHTHLCNYIVNNV